MPKPIFGSLSHLNNPQFDNKFSNYHTQDAAAKTAKALGLDGAPMGGGKYKYNNSVFDKSFNEFNRADTNRDGYIDEDEARKYYERYLDNEKSNKNNSVF